MSRTVYLDYGAATPLDERVFAVMEPYMKEQYYNPSAAYEPARQVRAAFEAAKSDIAKVLGVKRDEIIMSAGATESIFIAFHAVLSPHDHVVIGATEHDALRATAAKFNVAVAASTEKGIVTAEAVRSCITDDTKLVSVTAADSELGTVQPLNDIAQMIAEVRRDRAARGVRQPLYFHSDASQAACALDIHVSRLGVDMLTLNAGKCYGPKQVGLLWAAAHVRTSPVMQGGGQERGLRGGTENVAGAIGFARALEIAQSHRHKENKRLTHLRASLAELITTELPEVIVNGHPKKHLPSHLHISLPGLDAERVVYRLDMEGVYVATGAACAANKGTRSAVLSGIGMDEAVADGSLRLTLGRFTTEEDVKLAVPKIIAAIKKEANQ